MVSALRFQTVPWSNLENMQAEALKLYLEGWEEFGEAEGLRVCKKSMVQREVKEVGLER